MGLQHALHPLSPLPLCFGPFAVVAQDVPVYGHQLCHVQQVAFRQFPFLGSHKNTVTEVIFLLHHPPPVAKHAVRLVQHHLCQSHRL